MNEKIEVDFFGDGMRIFLDYIQRQFKKNPDYIPHPLIRAFECAILKINEIEVGQRTMGVSQDGSATNIGNPFIVVLEKKKDGIEVVEIHNTKVDKSVPIDVVLRMFRLQIILDRFDGDCINPQQMVESLNLVIPGNKFYALGDRWKEARDKFKILLEEGKFAMPNDQKLISELKKITYNTPWEEYPNDLRALIGGAIAGSISPEGGTIVITSPVDSKIEKFKVFDTAMEVLLGKSSKYIK